MCSDNELDYTSPSILVFLRYICRNCGVTTKTYALTLTPILTQAKGGRGVVLTEDAHATEFGELPPFGPPVPARLISLVGPDCDAYLKGRRPENQGLGIGAFAYYRRVVEEQKTRLIDEIIRVAERTQAPADMVETLKAARGETQFSKAVDAIKGAIPESLKIDGHNPLVLLHRARSEGLHAQTDEQCLKLASSIRVVLEELADRAATALKGHAELRSAISRLMNKR